MAAKNLPAGADIAAPTSRNNGCEPFSMALHAEQIAPDLLEAGDLPLDSLLVASVSLLTTCLTIARTRFCIRQFLSHGRQNLHLLTGASSF